MGILTKRMMIRFSDEDEAWIAEQAQDEGVDNATFVRMLVNRMRRGRPALMRDVLAAQPQQRVVRHAFVERPVIGDDLPLGDEVDDMVEDRLGDDPPPGPTPITAHTRIEEGTADQILARRARTNPALAAMPAMAGAAPAEPSGTGAQRLHSVPRVQYNPGRTGLG